VIFSGPHLLVPTARALRRRAAPQRAKNART
jgi:hypothetical protein